MKPVTIRIEETVGTSGLFKDGDWVESKDQDSNGNIRLIQLADIGVGVFKDKSNKSMNHEKFTLLNCTELIPGDILIARMPDPIGRACIFPGDTRKCATVVDIAILRVDPDVAYNRYVMHCINTEQTRNVIENYVSGTTRKRISRTNLGKIPINLPSLEEQRRIADKLDLAEQLKDVRQKSVEKLDLLAQSIFLDMFGDPIHNEKDWEKVKFLEVGILERGKSKHRPRNAPELLGGVHPLVQTGDIANSKGYIETYSSTYSDIGLAQSKIWNKGTLCITIAANIAKTGILTFDACFPDSVVGFIPNEKTNVEYVQVWLSFLQKQLEESAPESAQKNINLQILRNLEIPLPPKDLQDIFAGSISYIKRLNECFELSNAKIKNLGNSLKAGIFAEILV